MTDAVFFPPGVDRTQVYSVLTPNVRFIEVVEDGLSSGNVLPPDFRPTAEGLARVRENIVKAGVVGRLVANDFSGAVVSARLQEFNPNTGERLDYLEVAEALERIRGKADAKSPAAVFVDMHLIGFAKAVGDIAAGAAQVALFFVVTFAVTALFLYLYARAASGRGGARLRALRDGLAARRTHRPRLRHRSDIHPSAVPGLCDRR